MAAALRTVANVELARAGVEYQLSTGPCTFTPEDLRDAVMAANEDISVPTPRLKLGHIDPRYNDQSTYDGSPAFGRATNLRLSDNGMAIMADYVGVPAWLAEIMATAYPSRSVEGWHNVETNAGKHWQFVITDVALLGITWPGISVIEDLPLYYGEEVPPDVVIDPELVAAAQQPGGDPMKNPFKRTAASANLDDIRRAFYNEYMAANADARYWWICAVMTDPNQLVVENDETGQLYLMSFASSDEGVVSFGDPEPVRVDYVPDNREAQKAAATHVAAAITSAGNVLASWDTRASSRPDDNTGGAMDPAMVRQALGLPEDATDEQVTAAFAASFGETSTPPAPDPPTPPEPPAPGTPPEGEPTPDNVVTLPVTPATPAALPAVAAGAVPPGAVLIDAAAFAQMRADGEAAREVVQERRTERIASAVAAAIADGRIPPSRREHWEAYLKQDFDGGVATLASFQAGIIPVEERGHAGTSTDPVTDMQQITDDTVTATTEALFPEVARRNAAERAAAATGLGPVRPRISTDSSRR